MPLRHQDGVHKSLNRFTKDTKRHPKISTTQQVNVCPNGAVMTVTITERGGRTNGLSSKQNGAPAQLETPGPAHVRQCEIMWATGRRLLHLHAQYNLPFTLHALPYSQTFKVAATTKLHLRPQTFRHPHIAHMIGCWRLLDICAVDPCQATCKRRDALTKTHKETVGSKTYTPRAAQQLKYES